MKGFWHYPSCLPRLSDTNSSTCCVSWQQCGRIEPTHHVTSVRWLKYEKVFTVKGWRIKHKPFTHTCDRLSFVKPHTHTHKLWQTSSKAPKGLQTNTLTTGTLFRSDVNSEHWFQIFKETPGYSASVINKFEMYRFIWSHDNIIITHKVQHLEDYEVVFSLQRNNWKKKRKKKLNISLWWLECENKKPTCRNGCVASTQWKINRFNRRHWGRSRSLKAFQIVCSAGNTFATLGYKKDKHFISISNDLLLCLDMSISSVIYK